LTKEGRRAYTIGGRGQHNLHVYIVRSYCFSSSAHANCRISSPRLIAWSLSAAYRRERVNTTQLTTCCYSSRRRTVHRL